MPRCRGSHAPCALIVFSSTHQIEEAALNRAIAGGVARGSLGAATAEHYEEIAGETRLAITEHAAAGKSLTGDLSSLAFRIAYNKARDIFRRTRADALARLREGAAAETQFLAAACPLETAEAVLLEQGERQERSARLRSGLARLTGKDRATLAAMLARSTPLPRSTAAERRFANATAQAEKRARDRLVHVINDPARDR